jgi:hypothetical protein
LEDQHETGIRFDEVDKRIQSTEKRFDDLRWYFGGVTTLFMVGFSVITIVLSWNYKSERDSLRDSLRDFKEEVGKVEAPPSVELMTQNGEALSNQELQARFYKADNVMYVAFDFVVRNSGDGSSGPVAAKLYTSNPEIKLQYPSTDERKFAYEDYLDPKYFLLDLPGKMSRNWNAGFYLSNQRIPRPGRYSALLKLYYGKGKIAVAPVVVLVPPNASAPDLGNAGSPQ